jgi:uncharacterized membrane protein
VSGETGAVDGAPRWLSGRKGLWIRLSIPILAIVALLVSVLVVFRFRSGEFYGFMLGYVIPPAGKETVIPAAVAAGFSPFLVATYVAGVDMTVAWLLAWNWTAVTRLPLVGRLVEHLMASGREWMDEHAIADRSAFLALVVFVFFPMQGSGAVAGVTLGRLIGLPAQRAWLAIMVGALTSAFAWAYAAGGIRTAVAVFGLSRVLRAAVVLLACAAFATLFVRRIIRD